MFMVPGVVRIKKDKDTFFVRMLTNFIFVQLHTIVYLSTLKKELKKIIT